ncbi:MAG: (d)CMP kinase [Proteobacteria bacterium]|nr:(d)CMP kinase [Pseudomonadota bacterium]MDA1058772.1 (d)CMP kinase [Pseudomonadota bacterium]
MIVAIDGPAAAGKGTLARRIALALGFVHLDTGALYRAVGLRVLRNGMDPSDAAAAHRAALALNPADLSDPALREERTATAASVVSAHSAVRAALLDFQRNFAENPPGGVPGAVIEGRDIGTVVCPNADIKLFIDADLSIRARRRHEELRSNGISVELAEVRAEMAARDDRDRNRADSPLRPAPDAHLLDTTDLDIDGVFAAAMKAIGGVAK